MFCPHCGTELPDGSKFCTSCGTNLETASAKPEQTPSPAPAADSAPAPAPEPAPAPAPAAPAGPGAAASKKVNMKMPKFLAAGIVVLVLIVAALIFSSMSGSANAIRFAYLSGGELRLSKNADANKSLTFANSNNTMLSQDFVQFSADGKYVYFFTKYDSDNQTGTLCRAQVSKLKDGADKNTKVIQTIDTYVDITSLTLTANGAVYQNGDGDLYSYDGKESTRLAREVDWYRCGEGEDTRLIYATVGGADGSALYGVDLAAPADPVKVATNYAYIVDAQNFDNVLYTKPDDNYQYVLYSGGFGKESEKIGNIGRYYTVGDTTYYLVENGSKAVMYDYLQDKNAEADAALSEPDMENYVIPSYYYNRIPSDANSADYPALYTSTSIALDALQYGFGYRDMQDGSELTWSDDSENDPFAEALGAFVEKYQSTEDEDGAIPVTDEIVSELQHLAEVSPNESDTWLGFCLDKIESGTTYDYDAYSADEDAYNQAENRIQMREQAKDEENALKLYTLYSLTDGAATVVADNVFGFAEAGGAIVYNTTDTIALNKDLADVYSLGALNQLFTTEEGNMRLCMAPGLAAPITLTDEVSEKLASTSSSWMEFYVVGSEFGALDRNDSTFEVAAITDNTLGAFSVVAEDVSSVLTDIPAGKYYYTAGAYESGDLKYGELYQYQQGTSTRLVGDAILDGRSIQLFEDGSLLCYTDCRDSRYYELTSITAGGESTLVGQDVTQYVRVDDKNVLYITDSGLYKYDGKKSRLLLNDVDYLWYPTPVEAVHTF